jgi:hypothetical protein
MALPQLCQETFNSSPFTLMTRYPRHPIRYQRTMAPHPFPHDGSPVKTWKERADGSVECELIDGSRRVYAPGRVTWALARQRPLQCK